MHIALITPVNGSAPYDLFVTINLEHKGSQEDCEQWALSNGLELPTLAELALIQDHTKGLLKPTWYWSCEKSESLEGLGYAYHGYYHYTGSSEVATTYRAIGVRRVPANG